MPDEAVGRLLPPPVAVLVASCLAVAAWATLGASAPDAKPKPFPFPPHDVGIETLAERGITFVYHVTEDSAKFYKPNHYEHGNGIAVADVDGDGLPDIYFVNQLGGNQLWKNLGGEERVGQGHQAQPDDFDLRAPIALAPP